MAWHDHAARLLHTLHISRAEVGRALGISGQAVTLKLQGKRPTTVAEIKVIARFARVTVAQLLGEDVYLVETKDAVPGAEILDHLPPAERAQATAYLRFLQRQSQDQRHATDEES